MDNATRKKVLRLLTYGLYVVTARGKEHLAAGTITWFSQSSFRPPLVMAGIRKNSSLHRAISSAGTFVVHIVGKNQKELATSFFREPKVEGDRLSGYQFVRGKTGAPILQDALAWLECRVVSTVGHGDHSIFIAEVVDAQVRGEEAPLTLRETGLAYGG